MKACAFILAMVILGIITGLLLGALMSSIPQYDQYLISTKDKTDIELMSNNFFFNGKCLTLLWTVLGVMSIATYALFAWNVNANIGNALKDKERRVKAATFLLIGYLLWAGLLFSFYSLSTVVLETNAPRFDSFAPFALLIFSGLLWFVIGETGLAGDFSSWKVGKDAQPIRCFILGGLAGAAECGLTALFVWMLLKYYTLVANVLAESGEPTSLGYQLLSREVIFSITFILSIVGGIMLVLAPVRLNVKQRAKRLVVPVVLLLVLLGVVYGVYNNAVAKYDFGKKTLAEAVGIPEKAVESKTVLILDADNISIKEWKMESSGFGWMDVGSGSLPVTYESLEKVENYINDRKHTSVYSSTAISALSDGYYKLWDVKKMVGSEFKNSDWLILHRTYLLTQLQYLPIAPENFEYLKEFTNESKWHAGGKSAISLAKALNHFGLPDEAKTVINKAKAHGDNVSDITFDKDSFLKDGRIYGKLAINAKTPAKTRIAVFHYEKTKEKSKKLKFELSKAKIVDACDIDPNGKFLFEKLGSGDYVLAIMTDNGTIPYNTRVSTLNVMNSPGVITLGAKAPESNLGKIDITF